MNLDKFLEILEEHKETLREWYKEGQEEQSYFYPKVRSLDNWVEVLQDWLNRQKIE